jgi:CheY-like chemotaxis protein/DNA-directed RNA polymerase specialized sigma24 family protein
MSISHALSAHIPYLRRFARALTRTQSGGDAYVMATLEAIIADPRALTDAADLRIALYRMFLRMWGSMPLNGHVDQIDISAEERGAQRNLEAISLRPRIAFLLSALEGFDLADVASTMTCTIDEAAQLIDLAGKEISHQIRTDVLIIEDEPIIAVDIQAHVEALGHNVLQIARTHREAIEAAQRQSPGLILADIQLADNSSGLEAVNEILGAISVPVIFITAYPERFLTGIPPEPIFLITKPFSVDSLKAVVSQALFFDRKSRRRDPSPTFSAKSGKVARQSTATNRDGHPN